MPTPEEIRQFREALGDTQAKFARRFNVSRRLVESWEGGQREMQGPAVPLFEFLKEMHEKGEFFQRFLEKGLLSHT